MDLIRQGDVLTVRQSSLINVDPFIYTSDFKMHHFTLFSVMAAIEKWRFSKALFTWREGKPARRVTFPRGSKDSPPLPVECCP